MAYGLDPNRIVCGSGSDELLDLLARAYAGVGDEVIHTEHGFLMYPISAKGVGATPVAVPEKNLHADVDALIRQAGQNTKILFLAKYYHNNCSSLCTKINEKCYCEINVVTRSVFSNPPSIETLEDRLRIGSFEPDEHYTLCNTSLCNSFPVEEVWTKGLNTINEDTTFKIVTNNRAARSIKNCYKSCDDFCEEMSEDMIKHRFF